MNLGVYVIIDPAVCAGRSVGDIALAALNGGVTMVQLRNKSGSMAVVKEQALAIQDVLADSNIDFIINDHVELAAELNAGGAHIGQSDMSPAEARKVIGDDKILGLTAYTIDHYNAIDPRIIDYIGTGPVYPTLTKPDKAVLGIEGFADLINNAPAPVVGIGGITPDNATAVIRAGAKGVAMMRSVTEAEDPSLATINFVNAVFKESIK